MQCPNCQTHNIEYIGLQWYPDRVFEAQRLEPSVRDEHHPGQGALHLYTCTECETSFVEDPPPLAVHH